MLLLTPVGDGGAIIGAALTGGLYVCPGFILSNHALSLNGIRGSSGGGNGISRLSICGGSGGGGAAIGAVANSDHRVLGGSMGGNPPYPTGRLRSPVNCPGRKLVPILMFLTFLSPPPNLGANLGQVPAPRRPGSPKSIPPEIKWYSLLRGVVGWSHVFKGIAS